MGMEEAIRILKNNGGWMILEEISREADMDKHTLSHALRRLRKQPEIDSRKVYRWLWYAKYPSKHKVWAYKYREQETK